MHYRRQDQKEGSAGEARIGWQARFRTIGTGHRRTGMHTSTAGSARGLRPSLSVSSSTSVAPAAGASLIRASCICNVLPALEGVDLQQARGKAQTHSRRNRTPSLKTGSKDGMHTLRIYDAKV